MLSSRLLDLLGVSHSTNGNVIQLPHRTLLVEEACSGINSLLFATAFCLFVLLWYRRPFWTYLLCIPLTVGIVLVGNVLRIGLGTFVYVQFNFDVLTGSKHELLSIVLVVAYIALILGMNSLLPPARRIVTPPANPVVSPGSHPRLVFYGIAVAFVLAGIAGIGRGLDPSHYQPEPLSPADSTVSAGGVFTLPTSLAGWSRDQDSLPAIQTIETLGLSSIQWSFGLSGLRAFVALDYPIRGYHDVVDCYTGTGWDITGRDLQTSDGVPPRWFEVDLEKPPGRVGHLLFATFNERGEWVDRATVGQHFRGRLAKLGLPLQTTFRVQLLIVTSKPLDPAQQAAATRLFTEAAALLSSQLLSLEVERRKPGAAAAP